MFVVRAGVQAMACRYVESGKFEYSKLIFLEFNHVSNLGVERASGGTTK